MAAGEVNGEPVEEEDEHEQEDRADLDHLERALRVLQLTRVEDRDPACVGGGLDSETVLSRWTSGLRSRTTSPFGWSEPLACPCPPGPDEARVRATIRFFPQGLSLRCLEDPVGGLHRDVLQRSRDHWRERGAVRRKRLLDLCGRIRAVEQRVDEVERELPADLVVREHLPGRVRPRVRVERLPLHPDRERRDQHQERRDDDQRPDGDRSIARERCALGADRCCWSLGTARHRCHHPLPTGELSSPSMGDPRSKARF